MDAIDEENNVVMRYSEYTVNCEPVHRGGKVPLVASLRKTASVNKS
jgi:hypothetical protein